MPSGDGGKRKEALFMGIIIPFDKDRKKTKKDCLAALNTLEKYMSDEGLNSNIRKMDQQFYGKYQDILAAAPELPAARIKYLSEVLLRLYPYMFSGDWETRYFAFMDFEDFFTFEFDPAVCKYKEINSISDGTINLPVIQSPCSEPEEELRDCLKTLISLIPEKNTGDCSKIVRQADRLFHIYYSILLMFSDELDARINQGLPQLNCYERVNWMPPALTDWHTGP